MRSRVCWRFGDVSLAISRMRVVYSPNSRRVNASWVVATRAISPNVSAPSACSWMAPLISLTAATHAPPSTLQTTLRRTTAPADSSAMRRSALWRDHVLTAHQLIELLAGHQAKFHNRFAQGLALFVRLLGDLGGVVVTNVRIERRDQHQR